MPEEPKAKTWRDLKSESPKPVSWRARFRTFMKFFKRIFYLLIFIGIIFALYKAYEDGTVKKAMTPATEKLKKIGFGTDGRITRAWLSRNGFFPAPVNLADIDIIALQQKFESVGQIKSVKIEKVYPDKITIAVNERQPIARLALMQNRTLRTLVMANDGVFFQPIEIPESELEKLPWITGVPLVIMSNKLEPYAHAPRLEEFLMAASIKLPKYFAKWESINVRELSSITLPIIMVTTVDDVKIIFHANDPAFQLEKLEYILRFCEETNSIDIENGIEKIDLSIRPQAVLTPRKTK